MISAKQVRALALGMPEAVELPHFERASFRVGGKIFATLAGEEEAMLKLDLDTHEALLEAEPASFFSYGGWSRTGATGVHLKSVKSAMFRDLLEQAWRNVAPKRLLKKMGLTK